MKMVEALILKTLMKDMRAAGYQPAAVWTGEDYVVGIADREQTLVEVSATDPPDQIERPLTDEDVFSVFADYDMHAPTLHFTHQGKLTWGTRGVMLVEGNGEDIISDYHVAEGEQFGAVIDAIYERIEQGTLV
ncbi:MAG TPA: hypothetical protein VGG49_13260 [Steroidobacteraceae bacterium]|jgi:hypothetical protein